MLICNSCKCNKCTNNVDNEYYMEGDHSCFNCDECYYYGMDNDSLSNNHKFQCEKFKISKVDIERIAILKRKKLKLTNT